MQVMFLRGKICSEASSRKMIGFVSLLVLFAFFFLWEGMRRGSVWIILLTGSLGTLNCAEMLFYKIKFGSYFSFLV